MENQFDTAYSAVTTHFDNKIAIRCTISTFPFSLTPHVMAYFGAERESVP